MQLPNKVDVNFQYLCPKCGDTYWLSAKEVKTPGFKIVCFCGNVMNIQPLSNLKVKYSKNNVTTIPVEGAIKQVYPGESFVDEAFRTLRQLGYKEIKLKERLQQINEKNSQVWSTSELVREYIRNHE